MRRAAQLALAEIAATENLLDLALGQLIQAHGDVDSLHAAVNRGQVMLTDAQLEVRRLRILVAWQASTLTEREVVALLAVDRLGAWAMLERVLADVADVRRARVLGQEVSR